MPRLTRICLGCEEPLGKDQQLCGICFAESSTTQLLGSNVMAKLQFLVTDTLPSEVNFPVVESSQKFLKIASRASLLVMVRYSGNYLGGIAATHKLNKAGLYLHCYAVKIPTELILFLVVLILEASIKGGQEEIYMPPNLAASFKSFCVAKLTLSMAPDFIDVPTGKKLLLRNLNPMFCEQCEEILEADFNALVSGPQAEEWRAAFALKR